MLLWTAKSARNLAGELAERGHPIGFRTVPKLLRMLGYSLQSSRKTLEGKQHPDRDAQFQTINEKVSAAITAAQPAISIDTKKKELVGEFKNPGREWHPHGQAPAVNTYDFPSMADGKATTYGIYDIAEDTGFVSVGIDRDTAQFSVAAITAWWDQLGRQRYPNATNLLITADCGDSNGNRTRLWKTELQRLADHTRLAISVCHFPPGTSKWNKVEHRLFSLISKNWRGRPLASYTGACGRTRPRRQTGEGRLPARHDTPLLRAELAGAADPEGERADNERSTARPGRKPRTRPPGSMRCDAVGSRTLPKLSKRTADGRGDRVQSVARALDLLEALAVRDESGLVEVAERTGLLPSTAHRLLSTLVARGYVIQNPTTGRYLLSYKVLELGSHVQRRTAHLRAVARPHLERVRKVCGETVNLVVLDDDAQIVYVDQLEGLHAMRMFMETGRKFPAYTAAAGKALLAFWSGEAVTDQYREHRFEPLTPRTITSLAKLRRDLERTRRRGFAVDDEEHETGVTCVAAAVRDRIGSPMAAISVSGPTQRLRDTGLAELGELLAIITEELSGELSTGPVAETA